jgi:galactokinase
MNSHTGTLGALRDTSRQDWILESGFGSEPELKRDLKNRLNQLLLNIDGADEEKALLINVPGRIEVLGKHTDYAGGVSLTCASSKSFLCVVRAHDEPSLVVRDAIRGTAIAILYDNPNPVAGHSWSRYVATVVSRLLRHFPRPERGVAIVMASNLPGASGMSSSSALVISIALGVLAMTGFPPELSFTRERFAGFAGALESGADFEHLKGDSGVGTKGGSQDHTAILCAKQNDLGLYSYFPVISESSIALPKDLAFVVASSGVKASKTGNAKKKYNLASERATHIVQLWNSVNESSHRTMGEMIGGSDFSRDRLREILSFQPDSMILWNRFLQFDRETNIIIPSAMEAVRSSNWVSFGQFVDESQRMAGEWLGNQVEETQFLARSARESGAIGASSFGAGFGGAVWALIPQSDVKTFTTTWKKAFAKKFPRRMSTAKFFTDYPSRGVFIYGTVLPGW